MTLGGVGMARKEDKVEEKCTDGLLFWEIVEHPWNIFVAFSHSTGSISAGVYDSPCRRRGLFGRCGFRRRGKFGRFVLQLLLPLGLPPDRFGLVTQNKVETGNVARAFSLGVDALRACWNSLVALTKGETGFNCGERVA